MQIWKWASAGAQTKEPWQLLDGLQSCTTGRGFPTPSENCFLLRAAKSSHKSQWALGQATLLLSKPFCLAPWPMAARDTLAELEGSYLSSVPCFGWLEWLVAEDLLHLEEQLQTIFTPLGESVLISLGSRISLRALPVPAPLQNPSVYRPEKQGWTQLLNPERG